MKKFNASGGYIYGQMKQEFVYHIGRRLGVAVQAGMPMAATGEDAPVWVNSYRSVELLGRSSLHLSLNIPAGGIPPVQSTPRLP